MSVQSVLLPVFVYVVLVFVVLGGLIVTAQSGSAAVQQFSANLRNQFEMPVLFLAAVAFALIVRQTDAVFVGLEWLFVLLRVVHAIIHVTVNTQPARGLAFALGASVLGIAWIKLAFDVLAA